MSPTNLLNRSITGTAAVLEAVGLSAIAFLGAPQSAKATTIKAGIDYLFTPAGSDTYADLPSFGRVYFKGVPVLPGGTDTAVKRLADCPFNPMAIGGTCTVGLQFESLNLMSVAPVNGQTVFLMLDPDPDGDGVEDTQPVRFITLTQTGDDTASWTNTLDFNWKLVSSLTDPNPTVFARGMEKFVGSGKGTFDTDGNFNVLTYDDQAALARHTDQTVPEPSATVPLALLGLAGIWGLKKKHSSKQD